MKSDTMVTYQRLDRALTKLGFTRTGREGCIVYRAAHDAVIILPDGNSLDKVPYRHLLTASATIVYKGIADQQSFEHALLTKYGAEKEKQGSVNLLHAPGNPLQLVGRRKFNEGISRIHAETRRKILQNLKKVTARNGAVASDSEIVTNH